MSRRRPLLSSFSSSTSNLVRLKRNRSSLNVSAAPVAASAPGTPVPMDEDIIDDYINPLDASPRWMVTARAVTVRTAASIGASLFGWLYQPTKVIWLDACSLLSREDGRLTTAKIQVDIWEPCPKGKAPITPARTSTKRPAVINFHGGGFFLGLGTDDAWWTATTAQELNAVVFSVSYRLAPAFPFPVPVEDCADAILQIAARADEFGIDPDKIMLSGFSAGGNLSFASWAVLAAPARWGYTIPPEVTVPNIAAIAAFYPGLDYTISRPRKRLTCDRPDLTLPKFLTDIIDASYVHRTLSPEQRSDPRLSPGLMDDELLERLPRIHLCLCEHDMLLAEGKVFAERLREKGKLLDLRVVLGERHAWDKPPPMVLKESAQIEYKAALESLKSAMGMQTSEGAQSAST